MSELFHERQNGARGDAAEDADRQRFEEESKHEDDQQWNQRGDGARQLSSTSACLVHQRARGRLRGDEAAEEGTDGVVQGTGQELLVVVHLVTGYIRHERTRCP